MKLVAASHFYNTPIFGIKFTAADKPPTDGKTAPTPAQEMFRHERHVHQGFRFAIGDPETPYDQLDAKKKELVGLLLKHKLAVIDDKTNNETGKIKQIDDEAALELAARKADVKAAKDAAAISLPAVLKQLSDVMAQNAQLIGLLMAKQTK